MFAVVVVVVVAAAAFYFNKFRMGKKNGNRNNK